jgi:uncharacterized protein YuzE
VKLTYDARADAAYVYLDDIRPGEVRRAYVCDEAIVEGTIVLDFGADGRLLGIEVLDAAARLPKAALAAAERIDDPPYAGTRP